MWNVCPHRGDRHLCNALGTQSGLRSEISNITENEKSTSQVLPTELFIKHRARGNAFSVEQKTVHEGRGVIGGSPTESTVCQSKLKSWR